MPCKNYEFGERKTIPIKKGYNVRINIEFVQHSCHYFKDRKYEKERKNAEIEKNKTWNVRHVVGPYGKFKGAGVQIQTPTRRHVWMTWSGPHTSTSCLVANRRRDITLLGPKNTKPLSHAPTPLAHVF